MRYLKWFLEAFAVITVCSGIWRLIGVLGNIQTASDVIQSAPKYLQGILAFLMNPVGPLVCFAVLGGTYAWLLRRERHSSSKDVSIHKTNGLITIRVTNNQKSERRVESLWIEAVADDGKAIKLDRIHKLVRASGLPYAMPEQSSFEVIMLLSDGTLQSCPFLKFRAVVKLETGTHLTSNWENVPPSYKLTPRQIGDGIDNLVSYADSIVKENKPDISKQLEAWLQDVDEFDRRNFNVQQAEIMKKFEPYGLNDAMQIFTKRGVANVNAMDIKLAELVASKLNSLKEIRKSLRD